MAKQDAKPVETATLNARSVLAKFQCTQVEDKTVGDNYQANVYMAPVTGDNPDGTPNENKSFSKWTPAGVLHLVVTNPDTKDFFESGKQYLISMTAVEVPVAPVV